MEFQIKADLTLDDAINISNIKRKHLEGADTQVEQMKRDHSLRDELMRYMVVDEVNDLDTMQYISLRTKALQQLENELSKNGGMLTLIIEIDDKKYGFLPLTHLSVEQYSDLLFCKDHNDELGMIACLYGEIMDDIDVSQYPAIADGESYSPTYKTKPYTTANMEARKEVLRRAPAYHYVGVMTFFIGLSLLLLEGSPNYLTKAVEEQLQR